MSLGKYLLDNYIISPSTRYENHTLIYTAADSDPIELRGILAAAILAALIVDTDEGDARGIALDTDEQREDFFPPALHRWFGGVRKGYRQPRPRTRQTHRNPCRQPPRPEADPPLSTPR